jgi:membrane-bound ClpP family serine protease
MELLSVFLLIILGVILLIVEFMLIPGLSIAGVGCFLSFAAAVFFSFKFFGVFGGLVCTVAILVLVPLQLYYLFKSRAMKKMMLNSEIEGKAKTFDENQIKAEDKGITLGRLAPGGKIKINGITAPARSTGSYIDPNTEVVVVKIEGNIVIVKPIN